MMNSRWLRLLLSVTATLLLGGGGQAREFRPAILLRRSIIVPSTSPPTRLRLPRCTAAQVPRVALTAGAAGLTPQWALTLLLLQRQQQEHAAHTAYDVVALVFMLLGSTVGVMGWWRSSSCYSSSSSSTQPQLDHPPHLLLGTDDAARWLAAVTMGLLLVWDLPVSYCGVVPQLRQADMLVHHVGMATVAGLGATSWPMPYLYFYLGVAELSSVPLLIYRQLDLWMTTTTNNNYSSPWLDRARETAKVLTAVAFTAVRVVAFTTVTVTRFLPDVRAALRTTNHRVVMMSRRRQLQFLAAASVAFCLLQFYWFYTQIVCAVVPC